MKGGQGVLMTNAGVASKWMIARFMALNVKKQDQSSIPVLN